MAIDPTDPGKLTDAATMLLAWATPPGIIALIVGWLGYRRRAREEQNNVSVLPPASMALATLFADRFALEEANRNLTRLATATEALTRSVDELTRAVRLK